MFYLPSLLRQLFIYSLIVGCFAANTLYAQDFGDDIFGGSDPFSSEPPPLPGQEIAPKEYVGSQEFFDISGSWVNINDSSKRISKLDVRQTIVNTYRIRPYFTLGASLFAANEVPLLISEEEMAYVTTLMEAKCMVMPMKVGNTEQLKIYSIIVDPAGRWTGMAKDIMVRSTNESNSLSDLTSTSTATTEDSTTAKSESTTKNTTPHPPKKVNIDWLQSNSLHNYWINEWSEGITIPRFQFLRENGKITKVRLYRIINEKTRNIGDFPVSNFEEKTQSIVVEWVDRGVLQNTMYLRPIQDNMQQVVGIDMIVEETFYDGAPQNIFRQFFVPDPDAERIVAAEALVKDLEGEWLNVVPTSPTSRLVINDGDIEIWVNCKNAGQESNECLIGKKELKPTKGSTIGCFMKHMASTRQVEIDVDLAVNDYFEDTHHIIAVNMFIENIEGVRPTEMRTEVFIRKDAEVPREAYWSKKLSYLNSLKP